jgi:mRNA-degrading endonuclease RelE of RelBE toxin-antitoxin system
MLEQIAVTWSVEARGDLRSIERDVAMQLLYCLTRYLENRVGDVKKLKPPRTGLQLRCGDYRVFFDHLDRNSIAITGVRHRRDAYR